MSYTDLGPAVEDSYVDLLSGQHLHLNCRLKYVSLHTTDVVRLRISPMEGRLRLKRRTCGVGIGSFGCEGQSCSPLVRLRLSVHVWLLEQFLVYPELALLISRSRGW